MKNTVKIHTFEIENVKRIKAVSITCDGKNLIIGGKNKQGKTSVISSICWALGGDRFKPDNAKRDESVTMPSISLTLSNGVVVERNGKNGNLKVTDQNGHKAGQALLNTFIDSFALDLPKFMNSSSGDKAKLLLKTLGVGEEFQTLETLEKKLTNDRQSINKIATQKEKAAEELDYFEDCDDLPYTIEDLFKEKELRGQLALFGEAADRLIAERKTLTDRCDNIDKELDELRGHYKDLNDQIKGEFGTENCPIEQRLAAVEKLSDMQRANELKRNAIEQAKEFRQQHADLDSQLKKTRKGLLDLLNNTKLPLKDLKIVDAELIYRDQKWGDMSGAEQLQVSTAIVSSLNPECGFVLIDKLEQMDLETLHEFCKWLEEKDFQIIATRVSMGDECSVIIEDGRAELIPKEETNAWDNQEF